jgi:flagellar biosynthesis/type III secretory pathway chaperone
MDYLRQKIENANGELAILEDNLQLLESREDLHARLQHIAHRMCTIIQHLNIDMEKDYYE